MPASPFDPPTDPAEPTVAAPSTSAGKASAGKASAGKASDEADGRRIAEHLLTTVAVLAIVGTILGLFLVQRVGTTYREGLEVTADGAAVASLGATSAEALAGEIVALADAAGASIDEARDFVLIASSTTADLGEAFSTNIADGVSGTGSIADDMASFIEAVERFIPGNRDSLAENLRQLSDSLEPVPAQLQSLGVQLQDSSISLDAAADTLTTIGTQLDQVERSIDEARDALVEVESLSADIAERAQRALDRSGTDLWLIRLLVIVLGIGLAGAAVAARRAVGLLVPAPVAPAA